MADQQHPFQRQVLVPKRGSPCQEVRGYLMEQQIMHPLLPTEMALLFRCLTWACLYLIWVHYNFCFVVSYCTN